MIAQLFKAAAKNRVPALSFIDEFSKTTAAGLAVTASLATLEKLVLPIDPVQTVVEAAHYGSMIVGLGYVFPMAANYIDRAVRGEKHDDPFDDLMAVFQTHEHRPSRLAGLAAGAVLSLSLAANITGMPFHGEKIHVQPLLDKGTEVMAALGDIFEKSYAPYDLSGNHPAP